MRYEVMGVCGVMHKGTRHWLVYRCFLCSMFMCLGLCTGWSSPKSCGWGYLKWWCGWGYIKWWCDVEESLVEWLARRKVNKHWANVPTNLGA